MTGQAHESGFLWQLSANGSGALPPPYQLSWNQEVVIGRDSSCQIVLDSTRYGMVSRRHVMIRPLSRSAGVISWEICDLSSANGTYVNGQRLYGCQICRTGGRIRLGLDGVEFLFECPSVPPQTQLSSSSVTSAVSPLPPDSVSFTQLFPIASTGQHLTSKAYLIPGMITVTFVVLMFASVGERDVFNLVLAAYLSSGAYYFVYQLCGKHKPWWVLLSSAGATLLILLSPLLPIFIRVFRGILPGSLPTATQSVSFPELLVRMFFGAGLMEELLKALPVLFAYWVGRQLRSPWRERVGVWEPLDGILLGSASAVGFTLLETLGQYVPEIARQVSSEAALQLLIPRILGSVAGHMAYSGYLGYFIGLSALIPRKRWQILTVGYLSAAGLHALWNATGSFNGLLLAGVGVISYAFLTAAILKARALSPHGHKTSPLSLLLSTQRISDIGDIELSERGMKPKVADISIHAWEADGMLLEQYAYTSGAVEPLPKHAHEAYQLGLSFDCSGEYHYGGEYHYIPTGSLSIIHSGEVHSPSNRTYLPKPISFWMMHVHPTWLHTVTAEMSEKSAAYPFFPTVFVTDSILNDLFLTLHTVTRKPASKLEQDTAIWQFFSYLVVHHAQNRPCVSLHPSSHAGVQLARDYLHVHYADEVSLDELAQIAGLSRFHFCRIFRKEVGLSPSTYQTQLRIAQAKKLLVQGVSLATVATSTGFYDQSHFGWHFKRQVGVTPKRYGSKAAIFS